MRGVEVVALALLIFAVPLAYSSLSLFYLKWLLIGLITPWIIYLWLRERDLPRPLPRLLIPLVSLFAVAVFSLLQTVNLYYGLQTIAFGIYLFLIYLVVAWAAASVTDRLRLARCLSLALLAASVFSLYLFLADRPPDPNAPGQHIQFVVLWQLFGNTNYGAAYLLTVIPLSFALFLRASPRWEKTLWGLTAFLSMVCLFLSRVRGAWVGIFVGLAVLFWVLYQDERDRGDLKSFLVRSLRPVAYLVGGVVILLPVFFPREALEFLQRLATIFDPGTESLQVRLAQWRGTLRMIFDHPWSGVGVGNFTFAYVPYRSTVNYRWVAAQVEHPHNEYLALWAELGPAGLLVFLWLLGRTVRMAWGLVHRRKTEGWILAGVLGGLAASALYANFFYLFRVPASALNLAILLGILEGMDRGGRETTRGLPLPRPLLLPILLILGLFTFQYFLRPLVGEIYYRRAEWQVLQGKREVGLRQLERALVWHPESVIASYRRAALLLQMKRYAEAIQAGEAALKVHPNLQLTYTIMALGHVGLGDLKTAENILRQALAINANYPHVLNNLGAMLLEGGRFDEAESLLKKAITVETGEADPFANLGSLYRRVGRYSEARAMYRQAAQRSGKWAGHVWYAAALQHLDASNKDLAYVSLARAIYLDERWRERAAREPFFEEWRRQEPRVRILLRLE
ncbi:MAG: O-antigen ligase family protein [Candidatus Methylomirabilales bacterium]